MLKIQKDSNNTLDTRLKMSAKKMGILELKIKKYNEQMLDSSGSIDLKSVNEDK